MSAGYATLGGMTLIGYARVSTVDQHLEPQTDQLTASGCERIFTDRASGARVDRPELAAAIDYARPGDVLVVVKLDRAGRSLPHLIELVADLDRRGVGFRSLSEHLDTTTPGGRLVFHIFGAIAQFERDLIRERTAAGLAAARARGRVGGRRPKLTPRKLAAAQDMYASGNHTVTAIAQTLGVSRSTIYRHLTPAAA